MAVFRGCSRLPSPGGASLRAGEGAFGGGRLGEGEVVALNADVDGFARVERAFEDFLGRGGIRSHGRGQSLHCALSLRRGCARGRAHPGGSVEMRPF